MKQWLRVVLCGVLWLGAAQALRAEPVPVVASFSILADLAREVGGEHVAVSALIGPDQDGHVYQPTPADVGRVANARLVLINGLGFEGWLTRLVQAAGYSGPVQAASDGVKVRTVAQGRGDVPDPHAWQDPVAVQQYVRNIAQALAQVDPAQADAYARNAQAYLARLQALDTDIQSRFSGIPAERRKVITTHDAMGYFGDRYGVTFVPAQGLTTASEPSARQLAALIRQVRVEGITALFVENMASAAVLRQIAAETGARVGGTLYSDALSEEGGDAPDYLTMMRRNADALATALTP